MAATAGAAAAAAADLANLRRRVMMHLERLRHPLQQQQQWFYEMAGVSLTGNK
jgi:hypothetical protein